MLKHCEHEKTALYRRIELFLYTLTKIWKVLRAFFLFFCDKLLKLLECCDILMCGTILLIKKFTYYLQNSYK